MPRYSLKGVADDVVLRGLKTLAATDLVTTADLLAHISEVDERRLYLPAACPSMLEYCVAVLRMSEDVALKRIRVARQARKYPRIYAAIADGRLNLTSVMLLAPHLTAGNADELLRAAELKSKSEVEKLVAARFPQGDVATVLVPIGTPLVFSLAPEPVKESLPIADEVAARPVAQVAPEPVKQQRTRLKPLSSDRCELHATVSMHLSDQIAYAQALSDRPIDVPQMLERAMDDYVAKLERRKFGRCVRSGPTRGSKNPRYVPSDVRRRVFDRDGGQCTFVSAAGRRCGSRSRLEFDHVEPLARGGKSTASNLRLCCRAHNQYLAECELGAGLMETRRAQAKERAAERRRAKDEAAASAAAAEAQREVIPWLRQLGFNAAEAKRGAAQCAGIADAPLEQRIRSALQSLAPASARRVLPSPPAP
jgi:5-methylcytosine-specific restriction endonuclease McrA